MRTTSPLKKRGRLLARAIRCLCGAGRSTLGRRLVALSTVCLGVWRPYRPGTPRHVFASRQPGFLLEKVLPVRSEVRS